MAIVKCKECGKDVSTEATACPNCGAAPPKKASAIVKYGGGFIVVTFVLAAASIALFGSPSQQGAAGQVGASAKSAPEAPPVDVSSAKLFADYEANEVAADLAYKGKRLAVKGIVKSIDKDFMDNPVVVLATPNQFAGISAKFSKDAIGQLAQLKKGAIVTLTCTGAGKVLTSPMLDCTS